MPSMCAPTSSTPAFFASSMRAAVRVSSSFIDTPAAPMPFRLAPVTMMSVLYFFEATSLAVASVLYIVVDAEPLQEHRELQRPRALPAGGDEHRGLRLRGGRLRPDAGRRADEEGADHEREENRDATGHGGLPRGTARCASRGPGSWGRRSMTDLGGA